MKNTILRASFGLLVLFILSGCRFREPILIGVSVELTGIGGKLGVAIRNGARLAVDQINAEGGINGRELELVVRDDQGDPDAARQADQELIDMGVVAIVGHITSQQTEAVYDLVNQSDVLLLSPTMSSLSLTGIDDNFFRVMPDNQFFGSDLGRMIYEDFNVRRLVCVLEENNTSYSSSLWLYARDSFEALGGAVTAEFTYTSGEDDLNALMVAVAATNPEAVLFIAPDTDTALLAQYGRVVGITAQYFSSGWAQTDELINKGGAAVEGMVLSAVYDPNSEIERYQQFVLDYETEFQTEPVLGAVHGYEAVMVLAEGLRQTNGEFEGLAEALVEIGDYVGLQGVISLDAYGDAARAAYYVVIQDRRFQTIGVVEQRQFVLP